MSALEIIKYPHPSLRKRSSEVERMDDCIRRLQVEKSAPAGTQRIVIDMEYCKGCGICAHECPTKAITMVKIEA